MKKIKTIEMEVVVASFFGIRQNLIVPNVSWGLDIHECDLLVVTQAGFCYEIEIKISRADLIKDKAKRHGHVNGKIKRLYFAIPDSLLKDIEHVPERAGIISVYRGRYDNRLLCDVVRAPVQNKNARSLSDTEKFQVARLGALRIWGLKRKLTGCDA